MMNILPLQYVTPVVPLSTMTAHMSVVAMVLHAVSNTFVLDWISSTYAPFVTSQIRWSSEVLVAIRFWTWNSWLVVVMRPFVLVSVRLFRERLLTCSALKESALLASSLRFRQVFALVRVRLIKSAIIGLLRRSARWARSRVLGRAHWAVHHDMCLL